MKNILIYGAGMMGKGVAQVFSCIPELKITMYDVAEMDVITPIKASLNQLSGKGIITEEEVLSRLSRIGFTTDINSEEVAKADMVIECVFEDMTLKQTVFKILEDVCSENTIFCTNTSVMSPTEISKDLKYKNRFVGTHFWNPAALIPLVEVVKTDSTDDKVAQEVMDILIKAGKKAVLCQKDVPGFIGNRMQHALWREAISIVEEGIADAKTVDEAAKYSFGLRLPQLGPLENADMVGLDLTYNIHRYILPYLCKSEEPAKIVSDLRDKGELGFKNGKGLQVWTEEEIEKSKFELNEYLINMIYNYKI